MGHSRESPEAPEAEGRPKTPVDQNPTNRKQEPETSALPVKLKRDWLRPEAEAKVILTKVARGRRLRRQARRRDPQEFDERWAEDVLEGREYFEYKRRCGHVYFVPVDTCSPHVVATPTGLSSLLLCAIDATQNLPICFASLAT